MTTDKITGYIEVGRNDAGEIVVNHPDLKPDENGIGHIVFSPAQARNLAHLLLKHADDAQRQLDREAMESLRRNAPPVDRSARELISGSPIPEDDSHAELKPNGQQRDYVILSAEERAKGFVRPVRESYIHVGKPPEGEDYSQFSYPIRGGVKPFPGGCLTRTSMSRAIAETYARDPGFYGGMLCVSCGAHRPRKEFIWEGTTERVGS